MKIGKFSISIGDIICSLVMILFVGMFILGATVEVKREVSHSLVTCYDGNNNVTSQEVAITGRIWQDGVYLIYYDLDHIKHQTNARCEVKQLKKKKETE